MLMIACKLQSVAFPASCWPLSNPADSAQADRVMLRFISKRHEYYWKRVVAALLSAAWLPTGTAPERREPRCWCNSIIPSGPLQCVFQKAPNP